MNNKIDKNVSPFSKFWNIVSTIGGVIGLVSISDDLFMWKSVIPGIISGYRTIVYSPFEILNIHLDKLFIDYLFIGSLCGIAFIRAISFGVKNKLLVNVNYPKGVKMFYFLIYLFFWPLGILITLKQVMFKESDVNEKQIKINFLNWLGILIVSFLLILLLNSLM